LVAAVVALTLFVSPIFSIDALTDTPSLWLGVAVPYGFLFSAIVCRVLRRRSETGSRT
jgi:hypothetical protein